MQYISSITQYGIAELLDAVGKAMTATRQQYSRKAPGQLGFTLGKKMETTVIGHIVGNQVQRNLEYEMETGFMVGVCIGIVITMWRGYDYLGCVSG